MKIEVKEVYVTRKNPTEIFLIIESTLAEEPNTQIFIDNEIYSLLEGRHGRDYNVYPSNFMKGFHYHHDDEDNYGGEEWLALTKGSFFDKTIARGSFISNCKGYMQLVEFHSSRINEYTHYMTGFKQLLLILFEPE